ncbi:MAG: hypothetical protein LBM28_03060 [Oscillospiraceae bacterium]|jgi:hypothetical protein|nr:hypothetical protein [Oscillospiraceae bacterium]
MMENRDEQEVLLENVSPEDLAEKPTEFIPSPKWKRALAWVMFGIFMVGILLWLLHIAVPDWTTQARAYFGY